MDFSKWQSIIAPLATPAAPALMLGNNLYSGMINAGISSNLAMLGAVTATVGMELSGMLMCSMALKAFRRQEFGVMWLAIGGAVIYALFVFFGIYTAKNAGTFATMVFITLIAYLGSGIYQYFQDQFSDTELGIREMDAERKLQNARNRGAKLFGGVQKVSTVHVDKVDTPEAARVKACWKDNPTWSARQVAAACQVSPTTASKYKP